MTPPRRPSFRVFATLFAFAIGVVFAQAFFVFHVGRAFGQAHAEAAAAKCSKGKIAIHRGHASPAVLVDDDDDDDGADDTLAVGHGDALDAGARPPAVAPVVATGTLARADRVVVVSRALERPRSARDPPAPRLSS